MHKSWYDNWCRRETDFKPYVLHFKIAWSAETLEYADSKGVRPPPNANECPGYHIKQSEGESSMLELWRKHIIHSLQTLPGPLWLWVVVPERDLSMGQIEMFNI